MTLPREETAGALRALRKRGSRGLALVVLVTMAVSGPSRTAWAVVGQAEEYDPFKAKDLEEFHQNLQGEEQKHQL